MAGPGGYHGGQAPGAAARAGGLFMDTFGGRPAVSARAPGRINIIGEHIDYNGGVVLPMAIDRDCVVAAGAAADGRWRVVSEHGGDFSFTDGDVARAVDGRGACFPQGDWRSYVLGVIACAARAYAVPARSWCAVRLAVASDVPLGAGLSSSASLEVAVARAVCAVWGRVWDASEAAALCRRAEHEFAGVPCGIMDQWASAGARAGCAMEIDCREPVLTRHVALPADAAFLVINTGVRHSLAGGEYAARAAGARSAAAALGVAWLCEADESLIERRASALTDEEHRLARHCVGERARVRSAVEALGRGDLATLGGLMRGSHLSLRNDYRVSCHELDAAVEAAADAPGALGARMTGGGFGGCAIALVRRGSESAAIAHIGGRYAALTGAACDVFAAQAAAGAALLDG